MVIRVLKVPKVLRDTKEFKQGAIHQFLTSILQASRLSQASSADAIHIQKGWCVRELHRSLHEPAFLFVMLLQHSSIWHYRFIAGCDAADSINGVTLVLPVILLFKSS